MFWAIQVISEGSQYVNNVVTYKQNTTSHLTFSTVLVTVGFVSLSGAFGLLTDSTLPVFGNDKDVPVFLSKTCC